MRSANLRQFRGRANRLTDFAPRIVVAIGGDINRHTPRLAKHWTATDDGELRKGFRRVRKPVVSYVFGSLGARHVALTVRDCGARRGSR